MTQVPSGPLGAVQDVETMNVSSEFGIAMQFGFGSGIDSGKEKFKLVSSLFRKAYLG